MACAGRSRPQPPRRARTSNGRSAIPWVSRPFSVPPRLREATSRGKTRRRPPLLHIGVMIVAAGTVVLALTVPRAYKRAHARSRAVQQLR
jgi:hypothetical protein